MHPQLTVCGHPTSVSALQGCRISVTAVDVDDVDTKTHHDVTIVDGEELTHQFVVPERLKSLSVQFSGFVTVASTGNTKVNLDVSHTAMHGWCNSTTKIQTVAGLHMWQRVDGSYSVKVLGRGGEPLAGD